MEPPDELVRQLNELGFALTEVGRVNTFARTAIGSEVYLTVESLAQDMWQTLSLGCWKGYLLCMERCKQKPCGFI